MALQGTLDTFALPDVLRLLATTKKSGQLLVQGDQGNGSLSLTEGEVVGGDTSLAETDEAHEVLFELLRLDEGSFLFDQDAAVDASGAAVDVESVITSAESAHTEWQDLSTVVPSLDEGVTLVEDLPDDVTTIDRERWKLIVAIGSGSTVRSLGDRLGLKELPVLRATRGLVDDGLASITDATDVPAGEPAGMPSVGADFDTGSTALPSLDDETDTTDLFGTNEEAPGDLPEPLPGGSVGDDGGELAPDEAARLEEQLNGLPDEQRAVIERAADIGDPVEAEQLLDELPDGAIDRGLMRRFLGSVRS
ncbi:MAG TPA: DUF4388 domain-containing protein [Acidimicrobiales bacterium]|nr:DUF4388 domain-containing protein [Acidimicrobiales bacterium]